MKRCIITALLLVILTAISLCACQSEGEREDNTLLVYCIKDEEEYYARAFNTYNSYCVASGLGRDYQVSFMTFENSGELNKKMTTEIMAGGGPDIFLTSQVLPFEKMMEAGMFADVDELFKEQGESLDMTQYNKNVLNAGVYSGKRYIVPLLYTPNASFADKDALEKMEMSTKQNSALSYNDTAVMKKLINYANYVTLDYSGYGEEFVERFICDYVDFEKKETDFETDEFKRNLELVKKLYLTSKGEIKEKIPQLFYQRLSNLEYAAYNFLYQVSSDDNNVGRTLYDKEKADNTVLYRGIQRDRNKNVGTIEFGVAINKNISDRKKAVEFIKYALGEEGQSHITNAHHSAFAAMAVNKKTFEKRKRNASELEAGGKAVGLDSEIMKTAVKVCESVEECSLDRSYYSKNIAGELVRKYLNGRLPMKKFIRQLKTATRFYLEE